MRHVPGPIRGGGGGASKFSQGMCVLVRDEEVAGEIVTGNRLTSD
jgi:hypothetical protein